jgi:RNA polymerase primary sigma factor
MPAQLDIATITGVLRARPGLDKYALLDGIGGSSAGLTTHDLNAFLYRHSDVFEWRPGFGAARLWHLRGDAVRESTMEPAAMAASAPKLPLSGSLFLYPWQQRALDAWHRSGSVGVVEAVTGAGKTRVALRAIADECNGGGKALILVPTIELVAQWEREICRYLLHGLGIKAQVGSLGGGGHDTLRTCDILVSTASSAAQRQIAIPGRHALLVADEVHHYGAEYWSQALNPSFQARLGLTATYEREDLGKETFLDPYFGGVCYTLDYAEALRDDVIANFRVAFVGVQFSESEAAEYEDASVRLSKYRRKLVYDYGLPSEPFGLFIREVQKLRCANVPERSKIAGFYLSAFTKRRGLMASSHQKLDLVGGLLQAIRDSERTILFSQTKAAATDAVALLTSSGIRGMVLDATMDMDERHQVFSGFESGEHELVAAPKLLDEGVDVPSADLAIVLATSRSRRQLVQRMGRVIRKKPDGREARVVILYVASTAEDPDAGAHEDFLDEIEDAATEVRTFRPGSPSATIVAWLKPEPSARAAQPEPDLKQPRNPSPSVIQFRFGRRDLGLELLITRLMIRLLHRPPARLDPRFTVSSPAGFVLVKCQDDAVSFVIRVSDYRCITPAGRHLLSRLRVRLLSDGPTSFRRVISRPEENAFAQPARLVMELLSEVLGVHETADATISTDL